MRVAVFSLLMDSTVAQVTRTRKALATLGFSATTWMAHVVSDSRARKNNGEQEKRKREKSKKERRYTENPAKSNREKERTRKGGLVNESRIWAGLSTAAALLTLRLFVADLEKSGVKFQKKPSEGKMRGLAFALDPDGT